MVGSAAGGAVGESLRQHLPPVPISLLMASVDLVLSSSYTSPSAGPAGYFSQIKKNQDPVSYHDPHVCQNHSPAVKHFPWNMGH